MVARSLNCRIDCRIYLLIFHHVVMLLDALFLWQICIDLLLILMQRVSLSPDGSRSPALLKLLQALLIFDL